MTAVIIAGSLTSRICERLIETAEHRPELRTRRLTDPILGTSEEIGTHFRELDAAMGQLRAWPLIFDAEKITQAEPFVTLDRYGELAVCLGFGHPGDERLEDAEVHSADQPVDGQGAELSAASSIDGINHGTVITSAGQALGANLPEDEDGSASTPLPEQLVLELTTHSGIARRFRVFS